MPPKSEREEILSALTNRIFSALVNDIIMDNTLQAHHEVVRSRALCHICETRCGSVHVPGPSTMKAEPPLVVSRAPSPSEDSKPPNETGTSTPTSAKDGNIYYDCVNCDRSIASSRFAPHLSSCLGLGSSRRGLARTTNGTKAKESSEALGSPSPSEQGAASDDSRTLKGKGKSKAKRTDEAEFALKRKRMSSPQNQLAKKTKKQKTKAASPVKRIKFEADATFLNGIGTNGTRVPSKLRESSIASFVEHERSSSPESVYSSPGTPIASASTPNSSAFSANSNGSVPFKGGKKKPTPKAVGIGPPKRLSPPRPPVRVPEPDYLVDVEGEETGSSTDTDSA